MSFKLVTAFIVGLVGIGLGYLKLYEIGGGVFVF